jgi:hypothetical protein
VIKEDSLMQDDEKKKLKELVSSTKGNIGGTGQQEML